jgi:hypothetical protein
MRELHSVLNGNAPLGLAFALQKLLLSLLHLIAWLTPNLREVDYALLRRIALKR